MNDTTNIKPVTSPNDEENTGLKYAKPIYQNNPNVDYVEEEDLNSKEDNLVAGLGADAFQTYDIDDDSLPGDDDEDDTESGMSEVDDVDLNPEMEKMGDVVINGDDEVIVEEEEY